MIKRVSVTNESAIARLKKSGFLCVGAHCTNEAVFLIFMK